MSQKSNANFVVGYALNLCKFHIYNVPYNHNIAEEGMEMTQNRVRIVDVADALGLSTATVSKVIHGKTEKISDKTVKRVQQELERSGYIPNMAGILLAKFYLSRHSCMVSCIRRPDDGLRPLVEYFV